MAIDELEHRVLSTIKADESAGTCVVYTKAGVWLHRDGYASELMNDWEEMLEVYKTLHPEKFSE